MNRETTAVLAPVGTFLAAVVLAGCGGLEDGDPGLASRSISQSQAAPRQSLIARHEGTPKSATRALLSYWRAVQTGQFDDAAVYYGPRLRRLIGDRRIVGALQSNAGLYRTSRPTRVVESTEAPGSATLRFFARTARNPSVALPSTTRMTWIRHRGWRIIFSSQLDAELGAAAARATQFAETPNKQTLGPRALRASQTTSKLQNRLFERAQSPRGD